MGGNFCISINKANRKSKTVFDSPTITSDFLSDLKEFISDSENKKNNNSIFLPKKIESCKIVKSNLAKTFNNLGSIAEFFYEVISKKDVDNFSKVKHRINGHLYYSTFFPKIYDEEHNNLESVNTNDIPFALDVNRKLTSMLFCRSQSEKPLKYKRSVGSIASSSAFKKLLLGMNNSISTSNNNNNKSEPIYKPYDNKRESGLSIPDFISGQHSKDNSRRNTLHSNMIENILETDLSPIENIKRSSKNLKYVLTQLTMNRINEYNKNYENEIFEIIKNQNSSDGDSLKIYQEENPNSPFRTKMRKQPKPSNCSELKFKRKMNYSLGLRKKFSVCRKWKNDNHLKSSSCGKNQFSINLKEVIKMEVKENSKRKMNLDILKGLNHLNACSSYKIKRKSRNMENHNSSKFFMRSVEKLLGIEDTNTNCSTSVRSKKKRTETCKHINIQTVPTLWDNQTSTNFTHLITDFSNNRKVNQRPEIIHTNFTDEMESDEKINQSIINLISGNYLQSE